MPAFIVISEKKTSVFGKEAKIVLTSHRFKEVQTNTYMGDGQAGAVAQKLRELDSYKKERSTHGIEVFQGVLNRV